MVTVLRVSFVCWYRREGSVEVLRHVLVDEGRDIQGVAGGVCVKEKARLEVELPKLNAAHDARASCRAYECQGRTFGSDQLAYGRSVC